MLRASKSTAKAVEGIVSTAGVDEGIASNARVVEGIVSTTRTVEGIVSTAGVVEGIVSTARVVESTEGILSPFPEKKNARVKYLREKYIIVTQTNGFNKPYNHGGRVGNGIGENGKDEGMITLKNTSVSRLMFSNKAMWHL